MLNLFHFKLIVEVVDKFTGQSNRIGKIQLQKMIYFLKQKKLPIDYEYVIHHYGPYCQDLSNDLELLASTNILNIDSEPEGFGFQISLNEKRINSINLLDQYSEMFGEEKINIRDVYEKELSWVIDNFSQMESSEIELSATTHYVYKSLKKQNDDISKEAVIDKVKNLKPHFSDGEIRASFLELEKLGMLN